MRLSMPFSLALVATAAAAMLAPRPAAAVDPGSELITCDRADERVDITVTSHLDPSCTWTRGVEILASNVTLDCQGAHIAAPDRRFGVYIHAPTDTPLTNIIVRNCHVEGFLNNFHIEREGFRQLVEGVEYENGFSNITIEDSTSLNSRGVGIFVNGYVEGVTLRNLHVEGAGSAGIYLEAGSKNCVVEDSTIVDNGFGENSPQGDVFTFGGVDFWFWGTGREGLAIDGSRFNVVRNNVFQGNTAGGIFLYKNCGEFVTQRPERWFHRRYGADGNLIENNTFIDEDNGVWIGSRMAENTLPMECSDPQYVSGYSLDYADDNVVHDNVFQNVTFGVRVEDDDAIVTDNEFVSADATTRHRGRTRRRTEALSQPVDGTVVTGNTANITGSPNPYRWIWGHTNTTFSNNQSLGQVVNLCEGVQPPVGPFVMTVDVVLLEDPENPPNEIRELPLPDVLPPCATACETGGPVSKSRLIVRRLDTPPGDSAPLNVQGRAGRDASVRAAARPSHRWCRGGDRRRRRHARARRHGAGRRVQLCHQGGMAGRAQRDKHWKYVDKSVMPPAGITTVTVKDLSKKQPGLLQGEGGRERGCLPGRHGEPPTHGPADPRPADRGFRAVRRGHVRRPGAGLHDGRQGRKV